MKGWPDISEPPEFPFLNYTKQLTCTPQSISITTIVEVTCLGELLYPGWGFGGKQLITSDGDHIFTER